jgi:hypothetical protein
VLEKHRISGHRPGDNLGTVVQECVKRCDTAC